MPGMETVFDFTPTDEELRALFWDLETAEEMRRQYREHGPPEDPTMVVYLLIRREQWQQAEKYAKKAAGKNLKFNLIADIEKARIGHV